jgi:hypothetical protein
MRYYSAGLSRACPEDERGWHQGAAMACAPPGAQRHAPANQRTDEKAVAMRSRITRRLVIAMLAVPAGIAPAIDGPDPGNRPF